MHPEREYQVMDTVARCASASMFGVFVVGQALKLQCIATKLLLCIAFEVRHMLKVPELCVEFEYGAKASQRSTQASNLLLNDVGLV